ncbi:unnamed protein product, partial [Prorocentrum cordatum]
ELQALVQPVVPSGAAQPARAPLLEETISASGVACRRAEKALGQVVAREDEAKLWLAECSQTTREAAVLAVQAKSEWQVELKAELQKTRGSSPGTPSPKSASDIPTGSQINVSQVLGDESGFEAVEIEGGDLLDLSDLEVGDEDKRKCFALKGIIAVEIQEAMLPGIGPTAYNIQRLRPVARDMRKRLAAKRARKDDREESPKDASASGSPPPKVAEAPPAAPADAPGAELAVPETAGAPVSGSAPSGQLLEAAVEAARAKLAEGEHQRLMPDEAGRQLVGNQPFGILPQEDPDKNNREFVQSATNWSTRR